MKKRSRTYLVPASLLLALLLTLPAAGPFPARAAEAPAVLVFVNWTDVIFPQARAEVIARIRENTPLCPEEDALLSRKEAPYIVTEAELQYSEEGITAVCAGNGTSGSTPAWQKKNSWYWNLIGRFVAHSTSSSLLSLSSSSNCRRVSKPPFSSQESA